MTTRSVCKTTPARIELEISFHWYVWGASDKWILNLVWNISFSLFLINCIDLYGLVLVQLHASVRDWIYIYLSFVLPSPQKDIKADALMYVYWRPDHSTKNTTVAVSTTDSSEVLAGQLQKNSDNIFRQLLKIQTIFSNSFYNLELSHVTTINTSLILWFSPLCGVCFIRNEFQPEARRFSSNNQLTSKNALP